MENAIGTPPAAELLVCVSCRRGQEMPEDGDRPGTLLHDALLMRGVPEGVTLTPVSCLSNCKRGCTVVLRGPGRWTYVYGNLDETSDLCVILAGAEQYRATHDGLVPWRERPEQFRKNCIARIPPMERING